MKLSISTAVRTLRRAAQNERKVMIIAVQTSNAKSGWYILLSISGEISVHHVTYIAPLTLLYPFLVVHQHCSHADSLELGNTPHSAPNMPESTCPQAPCRPRLSNAEGHSFDAKHYCWSYLIVPSLKLYRCDALTQQCPKARGPRVACYAAGC